MSWSAAARAAAAAKRRSITHGLTQTARGNATGPGHSLLQALQFQHFRTRAAAIKSKEYNTPKQWGSGLGWAARRMSAIKQVGEMQVISKRMGKITRRYARLVGK